MSAVIEDIITHKFEEFVLLYKFVEEKENLSINNEIQPIKKIAQAYKK